MKSRAFMSIPSVVIIAFKSQPAHATKQRSNHLQVCKYSTPCLNNLRLEVREPTRKIWQIKFSDWQIIFSEESVIQPKIWLSAVNSRITLNNLNKPLSDKLLQKDKYQILETNIENKYLEKLLLHRGVFRTLPNIHDGGFFAKIVND